MQDRVRSGTTPRAWLLAIVCGLLGVALLIGGIQLAMLGGSWHYLVAGTALAVTGALVWLRWRIAVWLYAALALGTFTWAVSEAGLDGWALLPRVWPFVLLTLWFLLPDVRRSLDRGPLLCGSRGERGMPVVAALVLAAAVMLLGAAYARTRFVPVDPVPSRDATPLQRASDWPAFGGTLRGDRFSTASQITPGNAANLELAWTYRTGDKQLPNEPPWIGVTFEATPITVGDNLVLCTARNVVTAVDGDTGREVWRFDPRVDTSGIMHLACRGLSHYEGTGSGAFCDGRLLMGTHDARLIALDPATGRPCPDFGNGGAVDLKVGLGEVLPGYYYPTSPPAIVGDVAVIGAWVMDNQSNDEPPGVVRAYDVKTGALRWAWDVLSPKAHPPLTAGGMFPRNTPNFWSIASADAELGLVYLPTGNTPPDYITSTRTEEQHRYNSSIVALDANTGDVRWSFQTTHRDVWDYDVGSQPVLVDLPTAAGVQKALIAPTKVGEIFLLDRATGRPLAEVVEKPVPQDAIPGERLSPTQPFSVGMPSFTPPELRESSMWGTSPFDQLWCRIQFRRYRYDGLYTPVTTQKTIVFPSVMGTIDWGSVAVDPERRLMIVNSTGVPFVDRLIPRDEARSMGIRPYSGFDPKVPESASRSHLKSLWAQEGTPYAVEFLPFLSPLGIPCHQPPWGELSAVDLDTRRTLWRRPLGNTRDHAPFGIPFRTGMLNLGGAAITRGGVVFIAATADHYFRAFDVDSGRLLWKARLPAGGQANPMTFVSRRSGRQYVVIAAGGHGTLQTRSGDYVLAYALPQ